MNDDIYDRLKTHLSHELGLFDEDKLLAKIKTNQFSQNIIHHSKALAYNYAPFYKELSGYPLDTLKDSSPKKLNNHYLYFGDTSIQKIERYGKNRRAGGN